MRALNALFSRIFADPGSYGANPPDDDYLRDALSRRGVVALVARNGAEIVGGLTAYELPKLDQRRSEFYIYDLAVAETHRRRGIATMLIEEIRRIAREAGAGSFMCRRITGMILPSRSIRSWVCAKMWCISTLRRRIARFSSLR